MTVATTTAPTPRVLKTHHLLAAGLGVVLATAVATGGWQLSRDAGGSASVAPAPVRAATMKREPAQIFLLVGSQAQATAVLVEEERAAGVRRADGDFGTPDVVYVEVVNDAASLDLAMRAYTELSVVRLDNGLAEPRLIDLRRLGR